MRIKKAREQSKRKIIKTFQICDLKFEAELYFDMINWQKVYLSEPSFTRNISDDEINHLIISKKKNFPHLPCHTQAVKRCVKLVTEASSLVCGQNSRDGFLRSRIDSHQQMPSFETKREFKA